MNKKQNQSRWWMRNPDCFSSSKDGKPLFLWQTNNFFGQANSCQSATLIFGIKVPCLNKSFSISPRIKANVRCRLDVYHGLSLWWTTNKKLVCVNLFFYFIENLLSFSNSSLSATTHVLDHAMNHNIFVIHRVFWIHVYMRAGGSFYSFLPYDLLIVLQTKE